MNSIYRIVWSTALCTWVVASELATGRKKQGGSHGAVKTAGGGHAETFRLSMLALLLAVSVQAPAADRWWDANSTSVGFGGTGIWNTSNRFWSPNSDGVSGPYSVWSNTALDNAFFGGTAGTVTLGAPVTVQNLTFNTSGYTLAGSTLNLAGATPTITANGNVTISSVINGSAGLTKTGSAALYITGTNIFSGDIFINAGELNVTGNAGLGNINNNISIASGGRLSAGSAGGDLSGRTITLSGGTASISGGGANAAFLTGSGGVNLLSGSLLNNANNYTGQTTFRGNTTYTFSSIADLGQVSSLGAPTTVASGTIIFTNQSQGSSNLNYVGSGDSSNRNWIINPGTGPFSPRPELANMGSGTLILTGDIALGGGSGNAPSFHARTADLELLGVISSNNARPVNFVADAGRTVSLGSANTFSGVANITGAGRVQAETLANRGTSSSLGTGTAINIASGSTLTYSGGTASSDRTWNINNGALSNDGSGALSLSGSMVIGNNATLTGMYTGADNIISGIISGSGNLRVTGDTTWVLDGTNTYTGGTIVEGGVLRAGTTSAFAYSNGILVNNGTLDFNDLSFTLPGLNGVGGTVDLGSGTLTLNGGQGISGNYAGSIIGTGGLSKQGISTQTLTGQSTYTGTTAVTTGTLNLDFSPVGGVTGGIIAASSVLNMDGGTLKVTGASGENNTQTFNGLNVTSGNNTIGISPGSGGTLNLSLGAITRSGGLMNFVIPDSGTGISGISTTNADSFLAWATVNDTDYAKVEGGRVMAFEEDDYTDQDDASLWLSGQVISDDDGDSDGYFNTVTGSVQLGGIQYTQAKNTTVTVQTGEKLGVEAPVIVSDSVGSTDQIITGGMMTGNSGVGDALTIQQNSSGNFTIASQIVNNGNDLGFTKSGAGKVTLTNTANAYSGATRILEGDLSVSGMGSLGMSSPDPANLLLTGSTLEYTGSGETTDRGFTFSESGGLGSEISVTNSEARLTFNGFITSPDTASLTKSGPGTLVLANNTNNYTGVNIVTGGLLSVDTLSNGSMVSELGAASADSANLVLNGGGLQYTGATTSTDRGMTLGSGEGTIDVASAGTSLTVSGTVVGSGVTQLNKTGEGTLVLSGTNTYVGGNTVTQGGLRAGSTQAFGQPDVRNIMTLTNTPGVTLDLNNFDNFIGPLNGGGTSGGDVTLGSATLRIGGGGGSYSGTISGTGGVLRTNGGNQTFNGCNNTYTGSTRLERANLSVDCLADGGRASGIGASSADSTNLIFNNGALIYTGGSVSVDRGFQLLSSIGNIQVTNAATTLEFEGPVIGGGTLQKTGAGTLVLSGSNVYTGNTAVSAGVLRAGVENSFGSSGHMTLGNTVGAQLDLNGYDTVVTSLIGGGANGGDVHLGDATLTLNSVDTRSYAGIISGSGSLVKAGNGTQQLTNCNSDYTGGTTITGGRLQVACLENGGTSSTIGASSPVPENLVLNGGTLEYTGSGSSTDRQFTLGTAGGGLSSSGTGPVSFTSTAAITLPGTTPRTLTLGGTNTGTNILSARIDGNGTSLTKTGTGLWRLTNTESTYTGATTISGGVLEVDGIGDGGEASSLGAAGSDAANLVIGTNGTLRYTGTGDSSDRLFTLSAGTSFIESSGSGALEFTNTGAVGLTGSNTPRTMALGGTNTGDNTFGGSITDNGTGATTLAKNDSGTWILTGNNTFTGNTVINDGNLVIGNGGTTGNAGAGNVIVDSPTSTLSLNRSDTLTFSGTLAGPGTLAQIGSGTSILTSLTNDIGHVDITAGTLQVEGRLLSPEIDMSGTSALTVNGTVQAAGGQEVLLTGDAGAQTLTVNSEGRLVADIDLGDGSDSIDLAGTLGVAGGSIALGAGDDTLTIHDGAVIAAVPVDAGDGDNDHMVVDNAQDFTLDTGIISNFERLSKQNIGQLTLTSDQDYSTGTVIEGGTLNVTGGLGTRAVDMAAGTTLNVSGSLADTDGSTAVLTGDAGAQILNVGSGASLAAEGSLGDGDDTLTLAGTLDTGSGALNLGAGSDTLILQDGATLSGTGVNGGAGSTDTLLLDNALALNFSGEQTSGFETLIKQKAGTATMNGSQSFINGTTLGEGELNIAGILTTPTVDMADSTILRVGGVLDAGAGAAAVITGSAGDTTVVVGDGATLTASGDLGAGNDVLDVAGVLDTQGGVFVLGDGDDTLTIHEGTDIRGTVDAGAGTDTLDTHIDTVADLGAVQGFQILSKTGGGELNINGPLSSDFSQVSVQEGGLNITAGGSVAGAAGQPLVTTVAMNATLKVDGSYGCNDSSDSMTVAGTVSGTGIIDMCDGDDTLTLQDGAVLANTVSGGSGTADTLVLNNTGVLDVDIAKTESFERLSKDSAGTATLTGTQTFAGGTDITDGTLAVTGTLSTPTVSLASDTMLDVSGQLDAGGGAAAVITGTDGVNTVSVQRGGTLTATGDLGAGNDVLDVAGTLDAQGGVFALGDGDDNFVVHDGTVVNGTIDGGAGLDTRTYDINGTASLGALTNFEGVTKTGNGTLNITGSGTTDLQEVTVLGGVLDVHAGADIVATAGSTLTTVVGSGAILNVDGAFGCGDGADRMTVSGAVTGSGVVNLCGGDDTLVLNDGASLTSAVDGDAGSDTVVLNNAATMTLTDTLLTSFEVLQKDNTGEATLTGTQAFSGGTVINGGTLTVSGQLDTPTVSMGDNTVLDVDRLLQAAGGDDTVITGSSGSNTVRVRVGGQLTASGDQGDGEDVLDVAGTLDTGDGVLSLGEGSDRFTIHDGTVVNGTVDGGAGLDTFNPDINTSADLGVLTNFEVLTKTGSGVLNVTGPGQSDFTEVHVESGVLNVGAAGGIGGVRKATVASGANLNLDGNVAFTGGDDTLSVAGTVAGSGTLNMGDGNDTFTVQDTADLSGLATPVSGGAGTDTFVADLAGDAVLGGATDFETLTKTNAGTLHVNGPALSDFSTVNVRGGTLDIGVNGEISQVQSLDVAAGTRLNVDGNLLFTTGDDMFTVAGTVTGMSSINMLDGNDTLVFRDGADLSGLATPVDGGAGSNTLVTDIAGTVTLGGITNFSTLDKTGRGTLRVNGPAPSDFSTVNVRDGTLDIGVNGDISGVTSTTVGAGATLNVAGRFLGSAGDDTMTVAGTVSGSGVTALGDGDDVLTLNDGALLETTIDGEGHNAGDTVVLNNTGALDVDIEKTVNFEWLRKDNTGTAALSGTQTFTAGTDITGGTLSVAGTLTTPTVSLENDTTLEVSGQLAADGGTTAQITGTVGVNTVSVQRGGTLTATGDLGAGSDILDIAGTLVTQGRVFALGDGDDRFVVHDDTVVNGTVDGGAGLDTRVYDISKTATLGALANFEGLEKSGAGTLNITGPGATDLQVVTVLEGVLDVRAGADIVATAGSTLTTLVGSGATLNVEGAFGCSDGADIMTVSGTVSGSGTIDMCGGDDRLVLKDDAVLQNTISGGDHDSSDTVVLAVTRELQFDAARTVNFEVLQKDNAGEATLTGTQGFRGGTVLNGGTLTVAGTLDTPSVTMADNTVLGVSGTVQSAGGNVTHITGSDGINTVNVNGGGSLHATADLGGGNDVVNNAGTLSSGNGLFSLGDGDDLMNSEGRLAGRLDFGAGNDTARFTGGDFSGLTALDGGDGTDSLSFHQQSALNGDTLPLSHWESLTLADDSHMTLSRTLALNGGVMTIENDSSLSTREGAGIQASVNNRGLIDTAASRLSIAGDYTGGGNGLQGRLKVAVSPVNGTSGGLDIDGHAAGTTGVVFDSDGSDVNDATSIKVITAQSSETGAFVATDSDGGFVRLKGSIHPWTLEKGTGDPNWYLSTEGEVNRPDPSGSPPVKSLSILPEIPAYATLESLSILTARQTDNLVHQRLASVRGSELSTCGPLADERAGNAGVQLMDNCNGAWAAVKMGYMDLDGNPGFDVNGSDFGLYVGYDGVREGQDKTWRHGVYLGVIDGSYSTNGRGSMQTTVARAAAIDMMTVTGGVYTSANWDNGSYVNVILNGQTSRARISTADGFRQRLTGNSLTVDMRVGREFRLDDGWTVEPQLQASASVINWGDTEDSAGKKLAFNKDLVGTVRSGLRVAKTFTLAKNAVIEPWATVAVDHTIGQDKIAVHISNSSGQSGQGFEGNDLGTSASLDVGLEARVDNRLSVYGVVSAGKGLSGSDFSQQSGYVGIRVRW